MLSIEDAVNQITREPKGQPDVEDVTDVTEVEPEEAEEIEPEDTELENEETVDDGESPEVDDDDAEETEDDDDPLIAISTKRGTEEVRFSELTDGYLRQKDYTQKTQALSDEKRALEAEKQEWQSIRDQQYAQLQDQLATFAVAGPTEPEWDKLSGAEYDKARREWDGHQRKLSKAQEAYQALMHQQAMEHRARELNALHEHFPEWRNPDVERAVVGELVPLIEGYGFSQQDLAAMSDHRMFRVLDRLNTLEKAEARRMEGAAKVAKKVIKARQASPQRQKPGKVDPEIARRQKLDRRKAEGPLSIDDAVSFIMNK